MIRINLQGWKNVWIPWETLIYFQHSAQNVLSVDWSWSLQPGENSIHFSPLVTANHFYAIQFGEYPPPPHCAVDITFSWFRWHFAHVYLHDIVIISLIPGEHITHTEPALSLLKRAVNTLALKSCEFIPRKSIMLVTLTVRADLKSRIISLILYGTWRYRRHKLDYIHSYVLATTSTGFSQTSPYYTPVDSVNTQIEGGRLRQIGKLELTALWSLQEIYITPPILTLRRNEGRQTPDTEASHRRIVCVRLQKRDKNADKPFRILVEELRRPRTKI